MYIKKISKTALLNQKICELETQCSLLEAKYNLELMKNQVEEDCPPEVECNIDNLQCHYEMLCADIQKVQNFIVNDLNSAAVCAKFSSSDDLRDIYQGLTCWLYQKIKMLEWELAITALNLAECRGQCIEEEHEELTCNLNDIACDESLDPRCQRYIIKTLNVV